MNLYYLTIKFEGTTFEKRICQRANCQSDAITEALNKLSQKDFDKVEKVIAVPDKGNIEN